MFGICVNNYFNCSVWLLRFGSFVVLDSFVPSNMAATAPSVTTPALATAPSVGSHSISRASVAGENIRLLQQGIPPRAVANVPFLDRPLRTFGDLLCVHTGNVNAIWIPPSTPMFCQWKSKGGQNSWYYHSGHPSTGPEDLVPVPVENEEAMMVESFQDV